MLEPIHYRLRRDFEVLGQRPNRRKVFCPYCLPQHGILFVELHTSPSRRNAAASQHYSGSNKASTAARWNKKAMPRF